MILSTNGLSATGSRDINQRKMMLIIMVICQSIDYNQRKSTSYFN